MKKILIIVLPVCLILSGCAFWSDKTKQVNEINNEAKTSEQITLKPDGGQLTAHLNSNLDSDIAMVLSSPEGEGVVLFTKEVDGTELVDKLVLTGQDGRSGLITVDERGLPETYEVEGRLAEYSNYTETTVDITVTEKDGSSETFKGVPTGFEKYEQKASFFPTVRADSPINLAGNLADLKVGPKPGNTRADNIEAEGEYYYGATGLIFQALGCGSGAFGNPIAPIHCGVVIVRIGGLIVNSVVEIGPCPGEDFIDCARNTYKDYSKAKPTLYGRISDSETGEPILDAEVVILRKNGIEEYSGGINKYKQYQATEIDDGAYTISYSAKGYKGKTLAIALTSTTYKWQDGSDHASKKILVKDIESGEEVLSDEWAIRHLMLSIQLDSAAMVAGEVIDIETGEAIAGAKITIKPFGVIFAGDILLETTSAADGSFEFDPPVEALSNDRGWNVVVNKVGYLRKAVVMNYRDEVLGIYNFDTKSNQAFPGTIKLKAAGSTDGRWEGRALTAIDETPDAICDNANVYFDVIDSKLYGGTAFLDTGGTFSIGGRINADGDIESGTASGDENIATFTGKFSNKAGGGKWNDALGCYGSYSMSKTAELQDVYKEWDSKKR